MAFTESTVFPIPPDVILMPLALMSPRLAWWYALLTTVSSVLGALVGYFVGRKAGRPVLRRFFSEEVIKQVELLFVRYGGWAVGIAAFTPVPFKVFTFGAGIFGVPLVTFTTVSAAGRGARFFFEGALVFFLGEQAQTYLGTKFEVATLALTAALLLATWLVPKILPSGRRARPEGEEGPGSAASRPALVEKYRGVLRAARSVGTRCLTWAALAIMAAVFLAAFLEDVMGAEHDLLQGATLAFLSRVPLSGSVPGFWDLAGNPWVMTALLLVGVFTYARRQPLTPSGRYRRLLVLVATGIGAYALDKGLAFFLLSFGKEATWTWLLGPYMLMAGAFLPAWRRPLWLQALCMVAGLGLALGLAGHTAVTGASGPLTAGTSLIASAFAFCSSLAVLEGVSSD